MIRRKKRHGADPKAECTKHPYATVTLANKGRWCVTCGGYVGESHWGPENRPLHPPRPIVQTRATAR